MPKGVALRDYVAGGSTLPHGACCLKIALYIVTMHTLATLATLTQLNSRQTANRSI